MVVTIQLGVWIQWTGTVEWNGGMEEWTELDWNGMEWNGMAG